MGSVKPSMGRDGRNIYTATFLLETGWDHWDGASKTREVLAEACPIDSDKASGVLAMGFLGSDTRLEHLACLRRWFVNSKEETTSYFCLGYLKQGVFQQHV